MSKPEKKREGDFKWHACKAQCTTDYFIQLNGNAFHLLYNDYIAVLNEYNIGWHYQIKQPSGYFLQESKSKKKKNEKILNGRTHHGRVSSQK